MGSPTPKPTRKPRATGVTAEVVAAAALRIVDNEGLKALTMRRLGRELECDPMLIYRHYDGRDGVLHGVAEAVLGETRMPAENLSTAAWARELASELRRVLTRHPNVVPIVGHSQISAGAGVELVDALIGRLRRSMRPEIELVDAANAIIGALIGYITVELSPRTQDPSAAGAVDRLADDPALVGSVFSLRDPTDPAPLPGGYWLLVDILIGSLIAESPG